MDIPSLSRTMSLTQVQLTAKVLTMKKGMDAAEVQMQGLIDMMNQASPVSFGHSLDIRA